MTEVLKLMGVSEADERTIARAATVLNKGGLVAFPTETVYGLGAVMEDELAVARIFEAKKRPANDPLIVHVLPEWPLEDVFAEPTPRIRQLVNRFWPGPLTIVAEGASRVPALVTAGLSTVAVRAPSHPSARQLLKAVGRPVVAPSANRFSYVSATTADHVVEDLAGGCDLVLDGGASQSGIESTVVRVESDGHLTLLRPGALSLESLNEDGSYLLKTISASELSTSSPGRQLKHYSPTVQTFAVSRDSEFSWIGSVEKPMVYLGYGTRPSEMPTKHRFVDLGDLSDLDGIGQRLYATLRDLDGQDLGCLVIELTKCKGLGRAIDDRILRAASGQVLSDE